MDDRMSKKTPFNCMICELNRKGYHQNDNKEDPSSGRWAYMEHHSGQSKF